MRPRDDERIAIEAESDLREAIHDAYESAVSGIHDATEWEAICYPNDKTIYEIMANRIVEAAKNYFYRRSGNYEAALQDVIPKNPECPHCGCEFAPHTAEKGSRPPVFAKHVCDCGYSFESERVIRYISRPLEQRT